jgi:isovaleryl-CoA dehydrogenase
MSYNREQQEILDALTTTVRSFAHHELAPVAALCDEKEVLPEGIFKKLGALGILGTSIPEQRGGSGLGALAVARVMEELSAVDPGVCLSVLAHSLLFAHNLAQNGSDAQCAEYLPAIISGEKIGGMAMTEPDFGSDAVGMETRAVCHGDHYTLNGAKMFITNGPIGDLFLVYARTGEERQNLSTFIVERSFPGFSVSKKLSKMGMRASPTGELLFVNCIVPSKNRVGNEGDCVKHMMRNLDIERIGLAAMSLGIARASLEHAKSYAMTRTQFEKPIISFQSVSDKIAQMYIGYRAGKALIDDVCALFDDGKRVNQDAAAAKIFTSEMATKSALDAIQVLGGYGYIRDFPVERLMRDAKLLEIGGGTSEILRGIIIKEFLRSAR